MKKVVLVTGALGGIGFATARAFHDAGWTIIGQDIRDGNDDRFYKFFNVDVADNSAMASVMSEISKDPGRLDVVVNNAAVQVCKPIFETEATDWDRQMNVNLKAIYQNTKLGYDLLKKSRGAIVNVSSVHAFATSAGIGAYAASKGAVLAFTRAAAIDLAPDNIRVNAVVPGAVDTAMLSDGLSRSDDPIAALSNLEQRTIMGRVGRPEEIAQAILFLADKDRSSFITGQNLIVDGGALARLSTE